MSTSAVFSKTSLSFSPRTMTFGMVKTHSKVPDYERWDAARNELVAEFERRGGG
jgi:hypothetical protein